MLKSFYCKCILNFNNMTKMSIEKIVIFCKYSILGKFKLQIPIKKFWIKIKSENISYLLCGHHGLPE